jgi:autotransporter-associated beta strand protein
VALRFRWRLIAAAAAAGIIGAPQSVLAQTCSTSGIDPVTVACSNPGGIITTTNTTNTVSPNAATNDRIQSFNADLIGNVTATTTVNGAGLNLVTSKTSGGISLINNGAVTTSQALNGLQLNGNGGLITYSGNGNVSNTNNNAAGLAITNNGGGSINANTGIGTIAGNNAILLSTTGTGSIDLKTGGAITGSISTTAANGLNSVNVIGGTIQAAGFAIEAFSTGTGGVLVNTMGGQISGGLVGIAAASSGAAGDLNVTAGTISASEFGIFAGISNAASAGAVRVDVNGAIAASTEQGVSAGGFGAVTVNVANDITAGGRGVDAASGNGLMTVNQTAGIIHSTGNGINAGSTGTDGVTVHMSGGQIGTSGNAVGGAGIFTLSLGTAGDINVTANSIFSVGDGVYARIGDTGNAGNISVTINPGATVSVGSPGVGRGIFAESDGTGNIAIVANGNISTSNGNAIDAEIIKFTNNSTGNVSVINNANVVSGGAFAGVNLVGGIANSVTNTAGITGNIGLRTSGGMTSLTNLGTITGTGGTALQIDSGMLQLRDGNGAFVGSVIDSGVFAINRTQAWTFAGGISGTGEFQQLGTNTTTLAGTNIYTGATTINGGRLIGGAANAFSAASATTVNTSGILDLGGFNQAIGSLAGAGSVALGSAKLTAGGDGTSTWFSGVLSGVGGSFTKTGTGRTNLTGINTFSGATTIDGGTLSVNGSIASSLMTTVNAGGTLGGNGIVGNTTINGGALAPGNSIGLLTVQGSLVFTAASSYMVEVSPSAADRTNVTGSATLGGATVNANFAAGTYVTKQYTIVNAAGGINGTFGSLASTNLPSTFAASLSYDANNAYLNLDLAVSQLPGLNSNQRNVANALTNSFNATGGIPLVFGTLTPAGLTQVSGETATGSQQTTFSAMTQFITMLLDPFISGRGDTPVSTANATLFAEEGDAASAYATAGRKRRTGAERDAYGMITKAVPRNPVFDPRWSVWAAGFGGSQTTDGNAALGSNNTTSRVFGMAAGADYIFSPRTIAGFALAGGATQFSIANGGTGRSDLFQAGAFVRHTVGRAYISGALAYGWQDITTDRTVTIAGVDRLRAQFKANAFSGRAEGGYRFVTPWIGITPYAAGQFTTFDLPAYAEQVLSGANTFALAYGSKNVTASRSELGIRTDRSWTMQNAILTLRGRFAWAHDFNPDRNIAATFQTLPGASFVVNGAAQASDSALTTVSAEMKWRNGWSAAATFEGEFSDVSRSYAGKGVARYAW